MAPKELNFITGNKNKLAEVQAILAATPVELRSQNVDLVEIQGTIEEISTDKARRAAAAVSWFFFGVWLRDDDDDDDGDGDWSVVAGGETRRQTEKGCGGL